MAGLIYRAGGGFRSPQTRSPTPLIDSAYAYWLSARQKKRKLAQSTLGRWRVFSIDTSATQTQWSRYSFPNRTSPKRPSYEHNPHLPPSSCFTSRQSTRTTSDLWSGITLFPAPMACSKAKWKPGGNVLWTVTGSEGRACGFRIRGLRVGHRNRLSCTLQTTHCMRVTAY